MAIKIEQAGAWLELDQQIDVALLTSLAAGARPEDAHAACSVIASESEDLFAEVFEKPVAHARQLTRDGAGHDELRDTRVTSVTSKS